MRFFIGDMLTGRRIHHVPALAGSWSEALNGAGSVQCTVPLNTPEAQALDLRNAAAGAKSFLAAVDGDTVLQAGPIWRHEVAGNQLVLSAGGLWSYWDHRLVLPYPSTDPTSPAADTNLVGSLQAIARAWVAQARAWPNGSVPVVLPDAIAGSNVRNELGANLAKIGTRLEQLADVEGGPDVQFVPRFTSDKMGVEWVMRIGTPAKPLLSGVREPVFDLSAPKGSVSDVRVMSDFSGVATHVFAAGGRQDDRVVIASADTGLSAFGYPVLERVDASHTTVVEQETMQKHADSLAARSRGPVTGMTFDHQFSQRPFLNEFGLGDFVKVVYREHLYLGSGDVRMRVVGRSGRLGSDRVSVTLQPEVV